jgi:glycosyltransferase involved in cell wall biosynthesis
MRIAQMISGGGLDGASRYAFSLSRALAARGHDVWVFHRPGAWIGKEAEAAGLACVPTSMRRTWSEIRRVGAILKALKVDVIHTHMSSANAFGMFYRMAGFRRVATAHHCLIQPHWLFNDRVIAPSEEAARYMHRRNLVPRSRIVHIPNFVDTEQFVAVGMAARRTAREALGVGDDHVVFGVLGSLGERKRPQDAVAAFAKLVKRVSKARMVMIGGPLRGDAYATVQEAVNDARLGDTVRLLGDRKDVPTLLGGLDVLVGASSFETGPLAVLEAMAVGLPVVHTDVGAVREFVAEGETGHIVAVGDSESMAERMFALATLPEARRRMGSAGRVRVTKHFSLAATVPKIEAVLEAAARR